MAGGPIYPFSAYPVTADRAFSGFHETPTNTFHIEGLQVEASVGADTYFHLVYKIPPALPTGTAKVSIEGIANATTGAGKVNFKWKSVAVEESLDLAEGDVNAEGTTTITWAAGDANVIKQSKVALDADTVVADEFIVAIVVFETTGWTLAQVSTWNFPLIWE